MLISSSKPLFLSIVFCCCSVTICTAQTDTLTSDLFIGKWYQQYMEQDGHRVEEDVEKWFFFKDDGTYSSMAYGESEQGPWEFDKSRQVLVIDKKIEFHVSWNGVVLLLSNYFKDHPPYIFAFTREKSPDGVK